MRHISVWILAFTSHTSYSSDAAVLWNLTNEEVTWCMLWVQNLKASTPLVPGPLKHHAAQWAVSRQVMMECVCSYKMIWVWIISEDVWSCYGAQRLLKHSEVDLREFRGFREERDHEFSIFIFRLNVIQQKNSHYCKYITLHYCEWGSLSLMYVYINIIYHRLNGSGSDWSWSDTSWNS